MPTLTILEDRPDAPAQAPEKPRQRVVCSRCGRAIAGGERGPIVNLLAHYELDHGGVPEVEVR